MLKDLFGRLPFLGHDPVSAGIQWRTEPLMQHGDLSRGSNGEGLNGFFGLYASTITAFIPANRSLSIILRAVASSTVSPRFALALTSVSSTCWLA